MRITTFNILADEFVKPNKKFMDKWYPTIKYKDLKMKSRFHTILKYIKGDIILLQEVTSRVRQQLFAKFGNTYIVLPLSKHKTGTGNLTLVRRNLFKNVTHKTFYVGELAVGLTETDEIDIYNVHLDDISEVAREHELEQIIAKFDLDKKIIIGGDFNTDNKTLHNRLKRMKFEPVTVPEPNGTYICEKPMIDYIYVYGFSGSVGHVNNSVSNSNCYRKTIKKYGSDHYPVTVRTRKTRQW